MRYKDFFDCNLFIFHEYERFLFFVAFHGVLFVFILLFAIYKTYILILNLHGFKTRQVFSFTTIYLYSSNYVYIFVYGFRIKV